MKNNQYKNYFKKHYKNTLTENDILEYQQWFYSQWKIISPMISFDKNTKILEIGSGTGGFYSFISDKVSQNNYVGLELDHDAVAFSNKHFKSKNFKNISFETYTTSTKFDYIFAFEVLEHLDDPRTALQKMHMLLKPNGKLIATSPYPFEKNIHADKTHLFVLHPKNWERLLSQAGFSKVKLFPMSFLPFLWRINKLLNIRIPFYISFSGIISTCLFVAKKKYEKYS